MDNAVAVLKLLLRCWVKAWIDYLLRKRSGMSDYQDRQTAGLWIVSMRVEKWNDWAIADHCKHNGMSWTTGGVWAVVLYTAKRKQSTNTRPTQSP